MVVFPTLTDGKAWSLPSWLHSASFPKGRAGKPRGGMPSVLTLNSDLSSEARGDSWLARSWFLYWNHRIHVLHFITCKGTADFV